MGPRSNVVGLRPEFAPNSEPFDWQGDPDQTDRRPVTLCLTDLEWSLLLAVLEKQPHVGSRELGTLIRRQVRQAVAE